MESWVDRTNPCLVKLSSSSINGNSGNRYRFTLHFVVRQLQITHAPNRDRFQDIPLMAIVFAWIGAGENEVREQRW
ncbi:hypothetical protein CsatB_009478 [Cannabis sativa]